MDKKGHGAKNRGQDDGKLEPPCGRPPAATEDPVAGYGEGKRGQRRDQREHEEPRETSFSLHLHHSPSLVRQEALASMP